MSSAASPSTLPSRTRVLAFVAALAACAAGAGLYAWTTLRSNAGTPAAGRSERPLAGLPSEGQRPFALFRISGTGPSQGLVGMEFLDARDGVRHITPLRCERVHMAGERGLCLQAQRGAITSYHALLFDRSLRTVHSAALAGAPSRARVSPDGRYAAMTVFVSGHSYSAPGFSTRTSIIDARDGKVLVDDFESLTVLRNGQPFKRNDFNFWGVTFAPDASRFYATLQTDGQTLLVQGDLAARQLLVIERNVECPSLSPDGTRLAFKRRVVPAPQSRVVWGLHVLDLASGQETALAGETRSVDDQVEWINDREIAYSMPDDSATAATQTWALAVDGRSAPRPLLPLALSPAIVR
jgi:hypothetical protein